MSLKYWLIATSLLSALFTYGEARADSSTTAGRVVLAKDGQPSCVIVLPDAVRDGDKATEIMNAQAALQLSEFLRRMTGAKFTTVRYSALGEVDIKDGHVASQKVPAQSYVLVGESMLTQTLGITPELENGSMYIKAAGNVVALLGKADGMYYTGGTLYAVHQLLEDLGVCYLWPGELGLVVPKTADVTVPFETKTHTPLIKQRYMRMILSGPRALEGAKDLGIDVNFEKGLVSQSSIQVPFTLRSPGGWLEWQNLGGNVGISGGHAFGDLWDKYGADHPGWFALQPDGTRKQHDSGRAQLCLSNSELIQQIADNINTKADADPNLLCVPLGLNDGGTDAFCMCKVNALGEPGCTTYDPPGGSKIHLWGWDKDYVSLTDRYITFTNRIAEKVAAKHPNLLLVVDAYSLYQAPPLHTKLQPNLVVRYVPSTMKDWDAWSKMASKIYWRPNSLSGPWRVAELKFNSDYAKDLQYAAHHSTIATDFDSILSNWSTEGLNYYLLAKLNWDPDASVDSLVNDYCRKGFGPASAEIREYFRKVDELTKNREKKMYSMVDDPSKVVIHVRPDTLAEFYTPQLMDELSGLLDKANERVAADEGENETIRRRIAFLRVGLDWTIAQARAYRTLIAYKNGEAIDMVAAGKLLQDRRDLMRKIFQETPSAVNVAYVDYADRGYWQPMQQAVLAATGQGKGGATKTTVDADEEGRPIVVPKTQ